jgi:hypothetical protein
MRLLLCYELQMSEYFLTMFKEQALLNMVELLCWYQHYVRIRNLPHGL